MAFFIIKSVAPGAMSKTLGHRVSVVPASELSCKVMAEALDLIYVHDLVRKGWEHVVLEVSETEWQDAHNGMSNGYTKTGKLEDYYPRVWATEDMWT